LEDLPDPAQAHFRFWALLAQIPSVQQRWAHPFISWYGMTETITQNIHSSSASTLLSERSVTGARVQRSPCDSRAARTCHPATSVDFGSGASRTGRCSGVLHNAEATDAAFDANGWFNTGDEGQVDAAGHIHSSAATKDMLRVGEETSPPWRSNPSSTGSRRGRGAVIGKPDDMLEEVPVAFVVALDPSPISKRGSWPSARSARQVQTAQRDPFHPPASEGPA